MNACTQLEMTTVESKDEKVTHLTMTFKKQKVDE
jgi:hypothetical protein